MKALDLDKIIIPFAIKNLSRGDWLIRVFLYNIYMSYYNLKRDKFPMVVIDIS